MVVYGFFYCLEIEEKERADNEETKQEKKNQQKLN